MTAIPQAMKSSNLRVKFTRNEDTGVVMIEVANLSSKDVYVAKAQAEHIKQYPAEYDAFEKGSPVVDVGGTPLTDVPGVNKEIAKAYRLKGVRNAEELAALSDAACSQMGTGVLAARKSAQLLLRANQADVLQAQLDKRRNKDAA
jgi:flagellar capping protein FliD